MKEIGIIGVKSEKVNLKPNQICNNIYGVILSTLSLKLPKAVQTEARDMSSPRKLELKSTVLIFLSNISMPKRQSCSSPVVWMCTFIIL